MPKNKDFALRIEIIDECLRNRYRNWTLQSLINAVNNKLGERYGKAIHKRTIQDDLKYLREDKLAPLEKRKNGTETYFYYSDPNYSIKNIPINDEEINYLSDAIYILRQINNFKIIADVDEIISKLQNTVKTNVDGSPVIIQFEKHNIAMGAEYIDDIFTAIKEKNPLRISYQSFRSDNPKPCVFHPYLLKEYRNRWFVIGRRDDMQNVNNFALDRIKEIKNSDVLYIPNDLFDPEIYFKNVIGVTLPIGEKVQSIEVRVNAKQSPYIRTKPIHHTQEIIKEYKNGDLIIKLFLICNYELRSVLLGFGSDVEVIKPVSLRSEMKTILQAAISSYKE